MTEAPPLWHFTSLEAAQRITVAGALLRGDEVLARRGLPPITEGGRWVWLTSEPNPTARLLGFSDRTRYMAARFRVLESSGAKWWPGQRREHSPAWVALLESHAMPTLWWVAPGPVRVERDETYQDPTGLWR